MHVYCGSISDPFIHLFLEWYFLFIVVNASQSFREIEVAIVSLVPIVSIDSLSVFGHFWIFSILGL